MDAQQGLMCSLTGEHATFINDCPSFDQDDSVDAPLVEPGQMAEEIAFSIPEDAMERLKLEQDLPKGLLAALAAGLLGAVLWGVITVATNYQIGYMALAIGAGVGFSMRSLGKGIDPIFGILGGFIAVLSCVLGNFLSIIGFLANEQDLGFLETLLRFDFAYFLPVMTETFSPMDLFFYGFAGYEGYKFSFRKFTEEDIANPKR